MNIKRFVRLSTKVLVTMSVFASFVGFYNVRPQAAALDVFSIRPSRIEQSINDVTFLIKLSGLTTATEDGVGVTFDSAYTVDSTPANITVSTTGIANWDSACSNALPGIGSAANAVSGNAVYFDSNDLDETQTYCFLITGGIDNPTSAGNYSISFATRASAADVDSAAFTLPIVDSDQVVITATVASFVTCDVTTTTGSNNTIDLGALQYGTVTSLNDDIEVTGGTNATNGMHFYYRNSDGNVGLYNGAYTIAAPTSESPISPTTTSCTTVTPCYGIYSNGIATQAGGTTLTINPNFTDPTPSPTDTAGPMTNAIYGNEIAYTTDEASGVVAQYNVNATAGQDTPVGSYSDTLIFSCSANI